MKLLWFILSCYQFIVIDAFVKLAVIFHVIFVKTIVIWFSDSRQLSVYSVYKEAQTNLDLIVYIYLFKSFQSYLFLL